MPYSYGHGPQLTRRARRSDAVKAIIIRTPPPVDQQCEQVGRTDGAVFVEVGGAAFARSPTYEQRKEI